MSTQCLGFCLAEAHYSSAYRAEEVVVRVVMQYSQDLSPLSPPNMHTLSLRLHNFLSLPTGGVLGYVGSLPSLPSDLDSLHLGTLVGTVWDEDAQVLSVTLPSLSAGTYFSLTVTGLQHANASLPDSASTLSAQAVYIEDERLGPSAQGYALLSAPTVLPEVYFSASAVFIPGSSSLYKLYYITVS
ncbi:hypothetical protein B484DRAFT_200299 [Ochromonadaceae sp. CCMP2298]|nr:hypothetical protein B484DRAFT_200299 [Ochromonadaceae sp. CCMP2298]